MGHRNALLGSLPEPVRFSELSHLAHEPAVRPLDVNIVFTDTDATMQAIQLTSRLVESLEARVTVLLAQEVPYPLPLSEPPVAIEFSRRRLEEMLSREQLAAQARILLCRDRKLALLDALPPGSMVVVGERRHWWRGRARRLRRMLERAGHQVVLAKED